jgi:hypothetical protein
MTSLCWLKGSRTSISRGRWCRPGVEALAERLVPSFTPAAPVPVGTFPASVAVGDFNGDGHQDLAVSNFISKTVSIRLGDGHGGFSGTTDLPVGASPRSVAVGDFNGDAKPDLAAANHSGTTVTVLLNTFPRPAPPPAPPAPAQIVAVPFRRKGVSRVRVRDAATGAVRAVLTPFKGFGGRLRLRLADVNGDDVLDLVVRAVIHGKRRQKVFDAVTLAPLPPGLA